MIAWINLFQTKIFEKILSPKYFELYEKDFKTGKVESLIRKNHLSFPLVIKPINEGSSIGVKFVKISSS